MLKFRLTALLRRPEPSPVSPSDFLPTNSDAAVEPRQEQGLTTHRQNRGRRRDDAFLFNGRGLTKFGGEDRVHTPNPKRPQNAPEGPAALWCGRPQAAAFPRHGEDSLAKPGQSPLRVEGNYARGL